MPQLGRENLHATAREKPVCCNNRSRVPQLRPDSAKKEKLIKIQFTKFLLEKNISSQESWLMQVSGDNLWARKEV